MSFRPNRPAPAEPRRADRRHRPSRPAALTLALAAVGCVAACGSSDATDSRDDQEQTVTTSDTADTTSATTGSPRTDAAGLRALIAFPGEPAVLWATSPLGVAGDDRVPGPTDFGSLAVLDYGDAAAVQAMVTGLPPSPGLVPALPWFPPDVQAAAEGNSVPVDVYLAVPGFDPATQVGVVHDDPRYILVSYTTT